jgi:hypothetical protein
MMESDQGVRCSSEMYGATRMLNAERGMYIRHSLETDRILWQHGLSMRIVLDIAATAAHSYNVHGWSLNRKADER